MKAEHLIITATALACSSCALGPDKRPPAQNICVIAPQKGDAETAYLKRRIDAFLADYKFTSASDHCDVTVTYQNMGDFQGEVFRPGFFTITSNGYWSQEGMYTLQHGPEVLEQDESVNLRGYATKQEALDALAWALVRPVTRWFRSAAPSPKP